MPFNKPVAVNPSKRGRKRKRGKPSVITVGDKKKGAGGVSRRRGRGSGFPAIGKPIKPSDDD